MKPYREAIRRSWMGVTVHPSTVVSGRDRTPTAATRRQAAKSRCLPHKGGGGSTIRRRILELAKPRIIVRDAGGEIRRALFQEARHPFGGVRSEEHTSELQSLMRISYAVFCLKKKT